MQKSWNLQNSVKFCEFHNFRNSWKKVAVRAAKLKYQVGLMVSIGVWQPLSPQNALFSPKPQKCENSCKNHNFPIFS